MNQNNLGDMPVDGGMSSYEEFRNRLQEYFSNREITQADVDSLNVKNQLQVTEKQLCTEEIFYWLTKSEVLFSYEILEFFEQQNIHLDQLPWTPSYLRLGISQGSIFEKNIFALIIGGNIAAVDWKWYESQDYYDPDFDIYNDVTIKYHDQDLKFSYEIWNYPESQFPPVYAHSTVYDDRTNQVYITGGLGTGDRQRKGVTEIYQLNLESKDIQQVETFGESPPCLHNHETKMWNYDLIEMKGGHILKNNIVIKNLYVWYFNLKTKTWLKQESEIFQHWMIQTDKREELFLQISKDILKMEEENFYSSESIEQHKAHIFKHYEYQPNYQLYPQLYYAHEDIYVSKIESYPYFNLIYQCILQGQIYHCFEEHNRLEIAFQASASEEFQQFIINDLTSKLKQISGHDVIAEKVA